MASEQHISDGWEEISDDDAFSLVSAPASDPETVVVPLTTDLHTASPKSSSISQFSSPPSPSSPIEIPHSSLPSLETCPRLDSPADLPPAYVSNTAEAGQAFDDHHHADDSAADEATSQDASLPGLLCNLTMVESARAEVVRVVSDELATTQIRIGQQILDVCTTIGRQVEELNTILSIYKSAWSSAGNEHLNTALREWLVYVKRLLQDMLAEVKKVAYQSRDTANSNMEGELQSLYTYLVDYSQNMEEFLPVMLSYVAKHSRSKRTVLNINRDSDCNEAQCQPKDENAGQQVMTT